MPEIQTFRMRILFCKLGRAAFLSHLEVARALERAVRRAKLPYDISHGFSPHMRISFGVALPVGVGGRRECADIMLTRYVKPAEALEALQDASVPDLYVSACEYIGKKDPAASVAYPFSTYEVLFNQAPVSLNLPQEVVMHRKKGDRHLVVADFLRGSLECHGVSVTFTLESKPSGSLRPDLIVKELLATNEGLHCLSITRTMQCAG
ncbi:MAG: TIGR03936 family radical SAM-associated protein [Eggerthellaceae bacterium]|nr:TIGR03936 family radical SAM-associated protein [Eggerthellaceae bacterium]MCH4220326.1 TIGR03936 family radical SAM-associated protein [Eggerthellaceae bacterium]